MSDYYVTRRQLLAGSIAGAAAGWLTKSATQAAEPLMDGGMHLTSSFDGGLLPPAAIDGNTITFDLKKEVGNLNALVRRAPPRLRVRLLLGEKAVTFAADQGLITSLNGLTWTAVPLTKAKEGALEADLSVPEGEIRIATRYPYGRDRLERLLCDTAGAPNTRWRYLWKGHRGLPMFELGQDDGRKWIYFLCAGEDAWETAAPWTADAMIRTLCSDRALADSLASRAVVRIVPVVSPYSATQPATGYTTLDGGGLYAAAAWGEADPPPEIALLRAEVEEAIAARRLGFMMTIHSWHASQPNTGLETIQSAGQNTLSPERKAWAARVLAALIDNVPKGRTILPKTIWHGGLARDYLLAKHNAVTFRVEVTTRGQGLEGFRKTGRRFLENLSALTDWKPVCNP
jgi:hypothetical protein